MFLVEIVRPCTVGVTHSKEFDSFRDAEDYFERYAERLADRGWDLCDLDGSTVDRGAYEATHDDVADRIVVRWKRVVEAIADEMGA